LIEKRLRPAFVHEAVDVDRLAGWMDDAGFAGGAIGDVALLTGGTQNIIVSFTRGRRRFVLRRPPLSPRPGNNKTIVREARVLGALSGTDVPHPHLIAVCPDETILGAAFYLMEPIDGFNPVTGLPSLHTSDAAIRRDMGFALIDGAVALGRVDHVAVGLADFGRPDAYLERQVERWRRQLEAYVSHAGWPGSADFAGLPEVTGYLVANRPAEFRPGIMHGDYALGNVMYRWDGPKLAAIIDWELATIGDPLLDLGWIIATWRGAGGPDLSVLVVEPWDGFPAVEELVAHYAASSHRDVSSINWYAVLACYKLAIILEGTFARACSGAAPMETGRTLHETAQRLIQRALHRIAAPIRL
jgi:aminoglycoside phosphotransferase (APT) family kinase protein